MRQAQGQLLVTTRGQGLFEVTADLAAWVGRQAIGTGLLTVFCRHTSASLLIQENADPTVQADLEAALARLAPESPTLYRHRTEGPDDMPAHIRAALTATSLTIPVTDAGMVLGRWQGVFLIEHRRQAHRRELVLHLLGE